MPRPTSAAVRQTGQVSRCGSASWSSIRSAVPVQRNGTHPIGMRRAVTRAPSLLDGVTRVLLDLLGGALDGAHDLDHEFEVLLLGLEERGAPHGRCVVG